MSRKKFKVVNFFNGGLHYDAHAVNNIIVWDIHKRAFRTVCCDDVVVERVMTVKKFLERF